MASKRVVVCALRHVFVWPISAEFRNSRSFASLRAMAHFLFRASLPVRYWATDLLSPSTIDGFEIPPTKLRFKVSGELAAAGFVDVGKKLAENIERSLGVVGKTVADFDKIVDFGCGCGRVVGWLIKRNSVGGMSWYGIDTDREAIGWLRGRYPQLTVVDGSPLPPLAVETVDFIYAISVFTNLDIDRQRAWLSEFQSRLSATGVLLITFHGTHSMSALNSDDKAMVERQGYLFIKSTKLAGLFPEWYQTTIQTPESIIELVARYFPYVIHVNGAFGAQCAILASKVAFACCHQAESD
jgi:SAM-dependent methyltransferase